MRDAAGIGTFSYLRPLLQAKIREPLNAKDWRCWDFPLGEPIQSRRRTHLRSSRITKDYATTIRQTHAFAAHRLLQQRLHALQLDHHKTQFTVFPAGEALPSCRRWSSFAEPLKEDPDLRDGKARLASESDETQVELGLRGEAPLATLSESWWEDSCLLIETNGRGAETCTSRDFSNSHLSLDLKCALRFSIPSLEIAREIFWRKNMDRITFKHLPMIVKIAVWLVFNNAWWSLEEFVIDRIGLWKYMPYYKVANACVWDLAVATITALAVWRASGGLTRATVN